MSAKGEGASADNVLAAVRYEIYEKTRESV